MTRPSPSGVSGAAPLRVHLLGGFEIESLEVGRLGTRKGRSLLRRLAAAAGRPVPVDELVDVVWGDDPPANPHDQVSVLVSRLRGVLGAERLRRSDAGYRLIADWTDIVELEARVGEVEERLRLGQVSSALAAAEAALTLARGPLLPEEDSPWADGPRVAASRLVARARLLAAETALAVGDAALARAAAGAVLDEDPYDEAALRLAMRADAGAGRPAAALAAYESVRARLAEELGVDPAPETCDVHLAILQGRLVSTAPAPGDPPVVGRSREWRRLDDALGRARAGETAAVSIDGDAGMGKSHLLRTWARHAAASAVVLAGRSDELGRDLPLQPVIDALADHLATLGRGRADELIGTEAGVLAPLLGRVRAGMADTPVSAVTDAQSGRRLLHEALAAVLGRVAGAQPLVLVVDDLHEAATGTAEFLGVLRRRLPRLLLVVARRPGSGPELEGADRITLGPLTPEDAVALVGAERAPSLYARSGGHPLFLTELARAPEGELPGSVVESVGARVARLGDAAGSVVVAAVLGPTIDVDLLATVTARPVAAVLDDLERAAEARLLVPRGPALAFSHELVRLAVETATTPARRLVVHRTAAAALAARPDSDPLVVAGHARLGGEPGLAAGALVAAAARAGERCDHATAEALLDEAVGLTDTAPVRLARGRLRLGRLDLEGARHDAGRAVELGAGPEAFELAGWAAYYARDYGDARRYADEGVERASDDAIRASCLALAGRIRHTRGELRDAAGLLGDAVEIAPPAVRGVAQVWRAQLLAHLGEPDAAVDDARRGLLDPRVGHPFAPLHGRFTLAYGTALRGGFAEALEALDDLDRAIARQGDRRFPPVSVNLRGWMLRGAGLVDAATELHREAAGVALGPAFLEPRYAALLDLGEDRLAAGDLDGAILAAADCEGILDWEGSMSWRQRTRYRLFTARLALAAGDPASAAALAEGVAATAAGHGDLRYECRALLHAATARALCGRSVDAEALGAVVECFLPVCGPNGWRELAELAAATGSQRWFAVAERLAAAVVGDARRRPELDASRVAAAVRDQLDRRRP